GSAPPPPSFPFPPPLYAPCAIHGGQGVIVTGGGGRERESNSGHEAGLAALRANRCATAPPTFTNNSRHSPL
ncbi:unnamed protein product, partial [Lampetra planeri]